MSIRIAHQTDDEIVIDFHGLTVALDRDTGMGDGALRIYVDSADLETEDVLPGGHEIPRLRLTINAHTQQLDEIGNWVDGKRYEHTILDHLAEA